MIVIKENAEKSTNRKAIKNPFYKIHVAAQECGGTLPEEKRKEMMTEAIAELRENLLEKG